MSFDDSVAELYEYGQKPSYSRSLYALLGLLFSYMETVFFSALTKKLLFNFVKLMRISV